MRHGLVASRVFSLTVLIAMTACGGGGGSGGSSGSGSVGGSGTGSNTYPDVVPSPGDYFVFSMTSTQTYPAGGLPWTEVVTHDYAVVNADRSYTRTSNYEGSTPRNTVQFSSAGAMTSQSSTATDCSFSPAYRSSPPVTATAGTTYSALSTVSCTDLNTLATTTKTWDLTGQAIGIEEHTIPLGTFTTFKYQNSVVYTAPGGINTNTDTCWIDVYTGRAVECTGTNAFTPPGATAPSSTYTSRFLLHAYSFRGQAPVGAAVQRFTGYWNFSLGGGANSGSCTDVFISAGGMLSGNCTDPLLGSFAITGSVDINGAATLTFGTGGSFTGTFTSPSMASGTWSDGSAATGAWTAYHL